MASSLLEQIEALVGTVIAYDGRLAFWTRADVHDVRDIAPRLKCHPLDVMAAMPVFERVKRGRAKLEPEADAEYRNGEAHGRDE
jgi:hypothetical protein